MTKKQITQAKRALYTKYRDKDKNSWSEEDLRLEQELHCRDMIDSILVYGGNCKEDSYNYKRYLASYLEDERITKKRLDQLIEEQKATIAKATIIVDCYTDDEGCSYNSCVYEDD